MRTRPTVETRHRTLRHPHPRLGGGHAVTLLFAFGSGFFSVIGSRAGRAAQVRRHKPGSNYTLITLRLGARVVKRLSKISRRYATGAIWERALMGKERANNRLQATAGGECLLSSRQALARRA